MATYNDSVRFTFEIDADVEKAKRSFQDLQKTLAKTTSNVNLNMADAGIKQAVQDVMNLQGALAKANSSGEFNLTTFRKALNDCHLNATKIRDSLNLLGDNKSFAQIATQVQTASTKVNVLEGALQKFYQGLKNTFAWTLQSQAIHGLQSALQGAYTYAQQLNKGLTDIAIVSDLSNAQLTDFAKTANQMAKDLSASTKDVVSGALIYYQAGLSDEEVIKRTETTIKLAQTSGETAEQISSYMTAIWNNFYDGSESIEYYADAISYLGAVTAASNADIAEGIQAFASTAETVGLSFEYGASALTVLRDVTQQSASTIGNSLKTIFARLEGLKLGETLEDGVDLNKYTKALQAVGVEVLKQNGELRDADEILDDLADKWDKMTNAQQVALAQTVGGVRQYNNLISLMENYDKFQELVAGARDSDGYLQSQADKYAESWEAAKNRVTAAWQGIYDQLINDKFFIGLNNFAATLLNIISKVIDGIGGVPGILSALYMGLSQFQSFGTIVQDISSTITRFADAIDEMRNKTNEGFQFGWFEAAFPEGARDQYAELFNLVDERQAALVENNVQRAATIQTEIERRIELIREEQKVTEEINTSLERRAGLENTLTTQLLEIGKINAQAFQNSVKGLSGLSTEDQKTGLQGLIEQYKFTPTKKITQELANWTDQSLNIVLKSISGTIGNFTKLINEAGGPTQQLKQDSEQIKENAATATAQAETAIAPTQEIVGAVEAIAPAVQDGADNGEKLAESLNDAKKAASATSEEIEALKKRIEELEQKLKGLRHETNGQSLVSDKAFTGTDIFISATRSLASATQASSGLQTPLKMLFSMEKFDFTKLVSGLTSAGFGIRNLTSSLTQLGTQLAGAEGVTAAFGGKLAGLGSTLLSVAPYVGIAVGAFTALVVVLKKISDESYKESAAGKLEAANEQLAISQKLLEQANSELDNTTSKLEALHKNQETFADLEKGTSKWTQAVTENNEAVLELLDSYGMLSENNYTKDTNGIISLTKEAETAIQRQAEFKTLAAQGQVLASRNQVDQAKLNVNQSNYEDLLTAARATYAFNHNFDTGEYLEQSPDYDALIAAINNGTLILNKNDPNLQELAKSNELINTTFAEILEQNPQLIDALNKAAIETSALKEAIALRNQQMGQGIWDQLKAEGYAVEGYQEEGFVSAIGEEFGKQYTAELTKLQKLNSSAISRNYADTLNDLGLRYDDKKWYDANGTEYNPEQVRIALASTLATQIVKVQVVSGELGPTTDAAAKTEYEAEQAAQTEADREKARLAGAKEDINNNASDFSKKELASLQSLVEELKTGTLYAEKFSDKTLQTQGSVEKLAFAMKQADKGIEDWTKNWYDWADAIKNGDNDMWSAIEAMDEVKDASADFLGITDELSASGITLGATFGKYVKENLDTVYDAFSGSQEAALEMQKWAAEDIANTLAEANDITGAELQNIQNIIALQMDEIASMLETGDLKFGRVDDTELLNSLNNIINSIATSKEQAEAILAGMGFDAEVEEEDIPQTSINYVWEPAEYGPDQSIPFGNSGADYFATVQKTKDGEWVPKEVTSSEKVHALKIKTADYVGGGNITTSGGGGGARAPKAKSGGGGGSKQKTKEKDTTRYHEITAKIEQNQHALDMLNAQEERAYGQKKLDMMDQKLELLKQQAELYEELAKEAKAYYESDRDRLHNEYGAAFNPDGTIKDFDSWYGHFVDMYNSGAMSDDEWKKFEDAYKKYEESLKKMNEAEKKAQQNLFEQYDLLLEKVEYKLETVTKLIEMDMKYLDYMINMLDDDGLDTAEAMAMVAKQISDVTQKYDANKEALEGIFKNHEGITDEIIQDLLSGKMSVDDFIAAVGDFTEKEIESIQSIISDMFSNGEDLKAYVEALYGKLGELADKFQESIDKNIDKLDHMANMISKIKNIIDIMGKDTLGISDELLNRMQRAQIEISKEHLATLQQERDKFKLWLESLETQYDLMENKDSLEARELAKQIEEYRKTYMSLEEEILDQAADTAEKIKQLYRDMIEQTVTEAGKIIAGAAGDLEKLADVYEKQKNLDDRYLATYEKTYQTNKLLTDIAKALDNTDNIGTQEKLRDLQAEILDMQQDGVEVAKEQLEERRLYYELLLAEAALQEAQDAKSQVRMTRDSEGNWSYTYTADQSKVDDLRQKYNDALHAYEEFNETTLQTMQDTLIQLQQEYSEALATAQTEDEVRAAQEYFGPMIEHQREMIDYFITRNNELVDNFDVGADQVSTTLDDTVYGMVTGFETMDEAAQTMDEAYQQAAEDVVGYLRDMEQEQQELAGVVGITEPQINEDLDEIEKGVKDVHDEVDKISEEFDDEFGDALDTLRTFHETLGPIVDSIVGEIGRIGSKVNDVIEAYSNLNATPITTPDLSGPIGAFRALEAAADAAAAAAKRAANAKIPGDGDTSTTDKSTPGKKSTMFYVDEGGTGKQWATGTVPRPYATGGYTGAWGNEGKLAILHEKELVLNAKDTENMLKAIGFVRDLTQMISINASVAGNGLGTLLLNGVNSGGGYLDQNVTIHAEFPNATNHTEIEEAFSNLIGLATQYAGRKK